jgi:hypothetical protein
LKYQGHGGVLVALRRSRPSSKSQIHGRGQVCGDDEACTKVLYSRGFPLLDTPVEKPMADADAEKATGSRQRATARLQASTSVP